MNSDLNAQHKYLLVSVLTRYFILSGSHNMRNSEESFPIHTFSALISFTDLFHILHQSSLSRLKTPNHLLILHIKENYH